MKHRYMIGLCLCAINGIESSALEHVLNQAQNFSKESSLEILEQLHTPFTPTHTHISHELHLEAIINDKALISGEWYHLGAQVNGYTLTHIEPQLITLQKARKHYTLHIGEDLEERALDSVDSSTPVGDAVAP